MNNLKPHFVYNKKQRNGVFCLLLIVFLMQVFYVSYTRFNRNDRFVDGNISEALIHEIDSLKKVQVSNYKKYQFNPNFITDEKGYAIGMSVEEIDRLLFFRANGNWLTSNQDFQTVTKVSDSLFIILQKSFKFPPKKTLSEKKYKKEKVVEVKIIKQDINKASVTQLINIYGIGEKLASRIVRYRELLQGFSNMSQLDEVWGITKDGLENIHKYYKVFKKPEILKINVNEASFKDVMSIVYLDFPTTKLIFRYKDSVTKIQRLEEIKKIPGFPIDKYDRIALYLRAE